MNQTPNERLDRLTKIVVRAGGISEEQAERIDSSPFLHARVRSRIEAERKRRAEKGTDWFATLLVASRAIAVLLLVTITAGLAFWFSKANAPVGLPAANVEAGNVDRVLTGGACALSATEECAISTEEVLATLFAEDGGKAQR